jgi:hypothetical protein
MADVPRRGVPETPLLSGLPRVQKVGNANGLHWRGVAIGTRNVSWAIRSQCAVGKLVPVKATCSKRTRGITSLEVSAVGCCAPRFVRLNHTLLLGRLDKERTRHGEVTCYAANGTLARHRLLRIARPTPVADAVHTKRVITPDCTCVRAYVARVREQESE